MFISDIIYQFNEIIESMLNIHRQIFILLNNVVKFYIRKFSCWFPWNINDK